MNSGRPLFPPLARRVEVLFGGVLSILVAAIDRQRPARAGRRRADRDERTPAIARQRADRERADRPASGGARRLSLRARHAVSQQDAPPDAGLRGGGGPGDGARRACRGSTCSRRSLSGRRAGRFSRCCMEACSSRFRHLLRVPAELRANWGVQLAWRGQPRAFSDGVYRAGDAVAGVAGDALVVVPMVRSSPACRSALAHARARASAARSLARSDDVGVRQGAVHLQLRPRRDGKGVRADLRDCVSDWRVRCSRASSWRS